MDFDDVIDDATDDLASEAVGSFFKKYPRLGCFLSIVFLGLILYWLIWSLQKRENTVEETELVQESFLESIEQ